MANPFFERPILNSPYDCPTQHWELDEHGQPTQCEIAIVPQQKRIEAVVDDGDLEEIYSTERNFLYIARTRARDRLIVTGVDPASEFLDDLNLNTPETHGIPSFSAAR